MPSAAARPATAVRVMHVLYTLQPGGMEYGVVKLVNGLDPALVQSSICSTTPAGEMKRLVDTNVPVFELRRKPGNDPRLIRDLYRLFRRVRPDVVHTHAWGTLIEGIVAARLARVPAIVHGEHGTLQLRGYQKRLQRLAWGRADRVLSVSSLLAARMARETGFPVERIHTIRNGVDLSRFGTHSRADARAALGIAPEALVIGTAGRLVPVKDHATLLEAVAQLPPHLGATLLMAGDGPLRPQLEAAVTRLGIHDRVRMLGHCPDIEKVLAALDVFVLSSVSEGLSNTILEAMAGGLPVVATRVGGTEELVVEGETGLLVASQSPAAMADALAALLQDRDRRLAMARAGRLRAQSEFDLRSVIRRYAQMYLDTVGRASEPSTVAGPTWT